MTILTKSLLVVSVTGFVVGSIIDFDIFKVNPSWTVVLPFGAVSLGLFLISLALEKEAAKFDVDEAKGWQLIPITPAVPALMPIPLIQLLPSEKLGH
jgi:hypothetical protein